MTSDKKESSSFFKTKLKYILSFLLSGLFLAAAFYNVNIKEVLDVMSKTSFFWLFIYILIFFLSHYVRALRWKVILSSVKPDAKTKNLFGSLMIGYAVNCVIPRLGEVSRALLVGKWEGLSRTSMFGTVILERVIDVLFFAMSILIAILISTQDLYSGFPWLKTTMYLAIIFTIALIIFVVLIARKKQQFIDFIISIVKRFSPKAAEKSSHILHMLLEGFSSLKGLKNYIITIFSSALIIVLYALNSFIGFYLIGIQKLVDVDFGMGWIVMALSSIGVAIPTPGGTGSYHVITKTTLTLLYSLPETEALAYAVITHIIGYVLFIASGIFIFFILNKQNISIASITTSDINE